jgi:hypothetical protein
MAVFLSFPFFRPLSLLPFLSLPADAHPADLPGYMLTVIRGMAVQAADGGSREQLRQVVNMAFRAWPG